MRARAQARGLPCRHPCCNPTGAGARGAPLLPREAHLVLLEHVDLAQRFHGVDLTRVLFLHEAHLAERALADDLEGAEAVGREADAAQAQKVRLFPDDLFQLFALSLFGHALLVERLGVLLAPARAGDKPAGMRARVSSPSRALARTATRRGPHRLSSSLSCRMRLS